MSQKQNQDHKPFRTVLTPREGSHRSRHIPSNAHTPEVVKSAPSESSGVVDAGVFAATCCPICIEDYNEMEWRFCPCPCGYRLCAMCLHLIRQESDGKCPQCRDIYKEDRFRILSEIEAGPYKKPEKEEPKKKHFGRKDSTRPATAPVVPKKAPPSVATVKNTQVSPPPRIKRFTGGLGAWD